MEARVVVFLLIPSTAETESYIRAVGITPVWWRLPNDAAFIAGAGAVAGDGDQHHDINSRTGGSLSVVAFETSGGCGSTKTHAAGMMGQLPIQSCMPPHSNCIAWHAHAFVQTALLDIIPHSRTPARTHVSSV